MAEMFLVLLTSGLLVATLFSMVLWGWAFNQWYAGKPILPFVPRRRVLWDHGEILMTIGFLILTMIVAQRLLVQFGWVSPDVENENRPIGQQALMMLAGALVEFFVIAAMLFWVKLKSAAELPNNKEKIPFATKVGWGIVASVMLIPPSILVQMLVTLIRPYKHDVLDMISNHPTVEFFLVAGFAAVVVAPFAEEVFFRMLLQGWLESLGRQRKPQSMPTLQPTTSDAPNVSLNESEGLAPLLMDRLQGLPENPYHVSSDVEPSNIEAVVRTPYWPILVSASLFALMHFGQGLAPISLFVLSLGLGFLYRQTHSVVPCIVVHFTLNAFSLVMVIVTTFIQPPGKSNTKSTPEATQDSSAEVTSETAPEVMDANRIADPQT